MKRLVGVEKARKYEHHLCRTYGCEHIFDSLAKAQWWEHRRAAVPRVLPVQVGSCAHAPHPTLQLEHTARHSAGQCCVVQ